ncbi:MAG TPA: FG-GAP-like repeat-containing protein [Solimonas sp.]
MNFLSARARLAAAVAACLMSMPALAVMSTEGSLTVTEGGAASYSIPIVVARGTAGIQPDLLLNYNSQAGNGLMGVGWTVAGISVITRCPATAAQDGRRRNISFDAQDKFCLDGQRLVSIAGTYGANGTEYRTEIDSFTRVISYGTAGTGPAYFRAWTKSGQVIEYGNSADSRIEVPGSTTARLWSMNRLSDRQQNFMVVNYFEVGGDYLPKQISYTGHALTGHAPNLHVHFQYAPRPDPLSLYQGGARILLSSRLSSIQALDAAGETLRSYAIAYQVSPATALSRVSGITECAGGSLVQPKSCRPATTFTWSGTNQTRYTQVVSTDICANGSQLHGVCNDDDNKYSIRYPDINGDGKSDLCYRSDAGIRCYLSNGAGWDTSNPVITGICANGSGSNSPDGGCINATHHDTISYADINGDGLADLVYRSFNGIRVALSRGTEFSAPIATNFCADPMFGAQNFCVEDSHYKSLRTPDLNGDGRADLCWRQVNGIHCALWAGNGFDQPAGLRTTICADGSSSFGGCNGEDNYRSIGFVDVNADGKADLIYRGDQGIQTFHSFETGFVHVDASDICANGSAAYGKCNDSDNFDSIRFVDINGDGMSDLCFRSDSGVRCMPATGAGWDTDNQIITDICGNKFQTFGVCNDDDNFRTISFYGDLNGDGRADLAYRGDQGIQLWFSNGAGFWGWQSYTICANQSSSFGICNDRDNHSTISFADVNGDGIADLVYRGDQGVQLWLAQGGVSDLMVGVSTGLSHATSISYLPMTDAAVFERGSEVSYPEVSLQVSSYVVRMISASTALPAAGTITTTYRYGDLKAHQMGRGSLGFRWMEQRQVESGARTLTEYRQEFPYSGMPGKVEKFSSGGGLRSRSTMTYQCRNPASGGSCVVAVGARYFPFVSQSQDASWDLDGSVLPAVSSSMQYDNFGSLTQVNTSTSDGHIKSVANTYFNDTANWIIGLLTQASVTTTAP